MGAKIISDTKSGKHPESWYVSRDGEQHGPYDHEHFLQLIKNGNVVADDLVWNPQLQGWTVAATVSGLLPGTGVVPIAGKDGPASKSKAPGLFMVALNPGELIKARLEEQPWPLALAVSGVAFTLFFMQAGLDLFRAGRVSPLGAAALILLGIFFGTAGVCLLGAAAWSLARLFQGQRTLAWTMRAFGLSFAPTLVYVVLGLAANIIFSWNTSITFGMTGVLWAFIPISAVVREMVEGQRVVTIALTTLCGVLLLLSWAWLRLI